MNLIAEKSEAQKQFALESTMGTEVINVSFDVLQEELDKAKSNLKGLNDNIRRINGREPPEILRLVVKKKFFSLHSLCVFRNFAFVKTN